MVNKNSPPKDLWHIKNIKTTMYLSKNIDNDRNNSSKYSDRNKG